MEQETSKDQKQVLDEASKTKMLEAFLKMGRIGRKRVASNVRLNSFMSDYPCHACGGPVGLCHFGEDKKYCDKECRRNRHKKK